MKLRHKLILLIATLSTFQAMSERVVILHTNDTHSQIDPNDKNLGGVARRKAAIDSVKRVEPNVLVVDAGDAVQGTLYYTLFGGKVEQNVMNMLGYDVQIVGNHEFDNGVKPLADNYSDARPTVISSNYEITNPLLSKLFKKNVVKQVGNKRIGFLGLNVNPEGLINKRNAEGVAYVDALESANRTAKYLRDTLKVDAVVAVTHIGYRRDENSTQWIDPEIAAKSRGIDLIIGGHSHSDLRPGASLTKIPNLDGDTVTIVQNKNGGQEMGEVTLNFEEGGLSIDWAKILIDSRYDKYPDTSIEQFLAPYREKVDSVADEPIAPLEGEFTDGAMLNYVADFIFNRGRELNTGKVDLAIVNKGGIRRNYIGDKLTVGQVITAFPFDNRVVVIDVKGSDLREVFDIMARQRGNGVSHNVTAMMSEDFSKCDWIKINGSELADDKIYRVATIDYVAGGGDNMTPFKESTILKESDDIVYVDMLNLIKRSGSPLKADPTPRMLHADDPNFIIKCR